MCGVIGIVGKKKKIATSIYDALVQLQHRGQDGAGIVTADERFHIKTGRGLVRDVFTQTDMYRLEGNLGIGHLRYPTSGKRSEDEIQPFWLPSPYGIAFAHNGNIVNEEELKASLKSKKRRHFNTSSDTEVLMQLFADHLDEEGEAVDSADFFEQLVHATQNVFEEVKGSYAIVSAIIGKGLIAFRDPHGIRPLCMGESENAVMIASEPCAFTGQGFSHMRSIHGGELVYIDLDGNIFSRRIVNKSFRPCVFEHVYFARPDAVMDDISTYRARLRMGENLAKSWKEAYPGVLPDVVVPVPFTSNTAALACAKELGVRYTEGLYKNPFIGRTFIMPNQTLRKRSVRHKLSPQITELEGKNVLLLDDSIVRGTTSKEIIRMVRECGAKNVYFASACPPVKFPCYYGINLPTNEELIANQMTMSELEEYLGVDILHYQTLTDLDEAMMRKGDHGMQKPCQACLDGDYICGLKQIKEEACETF